MTTGPSPTSRKTDNTSKTKEVSKSSKQPLSKSKSTNSDDQSTTSTESIQVLQVKSGHGIYSSQPRFYIPAIQSRFQYTKDRFCYKIKVSFPWIDSTVPPTMGTYYTTIQQFFELVNRHDRQFEILPWDLRKDTEKTINHHSCVPSLHADLSQYVYNLQLTKTRIRFSCVITLSSNFRQVFRQKDSVHNKLSLLQQMQQKSIWVQQMDLQTMGDQKIIGYLQNIHPTLTDQQKLITDLQSVVETRDISLELFRPRAIDDDGSLIATTEAFAITVPIDISNQMHESLVDKWDDIKNGVYNDVIGSDSLLIQSYFIPFKRGICTHAVRNQSICSQKEYNRSRSGIYITQCNTVDNKFHLTHSEAQKIGVDHWNLKEPVSLRSLIMSYKQPNTEKNIVETIQNMGYGNFVLVLEKKYVTLTTDSISILLDTLTSRDDYNTICDTKIQTKPSLRMKKLSKKSQKYISDLQETIMRIGDKDDTQSTKTPNKRKHSNKETNPLISNTERISPELKKSTIHNPDSEESGFSSPEKANETGRTPRRPIAHRKLTIPVLSKKYIQLSKQHSSAAKGTYAQVALSSNKSTHPANMFSTLVRTNDEKNNNQLCTQISHSGPRLPTMIPLSQRETPTAISTTSTLTPNTGVAHLNSQISNDQVLQLKKSFKQQYDSALEIMERSYSKKFDALTVSNQKQLATIHSKIDSVNDKCSHDIEQVRQDYMSFKSQFQEQNNMLITNSEVLNEQRAMLTTITEVLTKSQGDNGVTSSYRKLKKKRDKKLKRKEKKREARNKPNLLPNYSSHDDNDLSYSDIDMTPIKENASTNDENFQSTNTVHCRTLDNDYTPQSPDLSSSPPRSTPPPLTPISKLPDTKHQSHSSTTTVSTITTELTDFSTITNEKGWTTIPTTDTSISKINHFRCVHSPQSSNKKVYNKNSPNYNHYDPTGEVTQRRSARLQEQSTQNITNDHPTTSTPHDDRRINGGPIK